mgnify:CR=1 FL=1
MTQIFPFRRCFARFTDYMIWGIATAFALSFELGNFASPFSLFYLSFAVYPLIEAALLCKFGATVGKKLFGLRIVSVDGSLRLSQALKRSCGVFVLGMGAFLPAVSLIAPAVAFVVLIKRRKTPWDSWAKTVCEACKTSLFTKILAVGFYVFLLFGSSMTVQYALDRELHLQETYEGLEQAYLETLRPLIVETLSPEAVEKPRETRLKLEGFQASIMQKRRDANAVYDGIEARIFALPSEQLRMPYLTELAAYRERTNRFFFAESIRLSLFERLFSEMENASDAAALRDTYMSQLEAYLVGTD